ncbi:MAG: hypothetical protein FWG89_11485 [Treponema sp.]|nr:hypothetical protein [Treponema sp.]
MQRAVFIWVTGFFLCIVPARAESFRTLVAGNLSLSAENPEGASIRLNTNSSAVIQFRRDARFLRGVELVLTAPQAWLLYQGGIAMSVYSELSRQPTMGTIDLEGRRIYHSALVNRLNTYLQIPIRQSHGLRTDTYTIVSSRVVLPSSFPILFVLSPISSDLNTELNTMLFTLTAKPILSDEGAVRLSFRYPQQLFGRPFTVLINDVVITNINEERILREGEHHLAIVSENYRNEYRRFMVERGRTLDLTIDLQDPTPLLIFEAPENTRIFLNNNPISRNSGPIPVEPGVYEARFHVGDYSITRTITVQRGKTYRVALAVGIDIEESE